MKLSKLLPKTGNVRVQDDVNYKPIRARLDDLHDQLVGYDKHIAQLDAVGDETGRKPIAEAIANGADVREIEPRTDNRTLLKIARQQRDDVAQAIAIVEAREREAFAAARARYLDQVRPEYAATAGAMADALIALGKAQEAAMALQDRVRAAGAGDWPLILGPLGVARLGMPRNEHSTFAAWLVVAVAAGVIDASKVPPEWRLSWGQLVDLERAKGDAIRLREVTTRLHKRAIEASAPQGRARSGANKAGW